MFIFLSMQYIQSIPGEFTTEIKYLITKKHSLSSKLVYSFKFLIFIKI